jgi:hypothetical protein
MRALQQCSGPVHGENSPATKTAAMWMCHGRRLRRPTRRRLLLQLPLVWLMQKRSPAAVKAQSLQL